MEAPVRTTSDNPLGFDESGEIKERRTTGRRGMGAYFGPLWDFIRASWDAFSSPRIRQPLKIVAPLVTIATIFYHFVEHWSWLDSFYFSMVALSTVGFGDLSPETVAGKLFTVAYIVLGMAVLLLLVKAVAQFSFDEMTKKSASTLAHSSAVPLVITQEPRSQPPEHAEIMQETQHESSAG
jgi:voltage-gated potassium channel